MAVVSDSWDTNNERPTIASVYCYEKVFRLRQQKGNLGRSQWTPGIDMMELSVWEE